jgi:hypothetical protein
MQDHLKRIAEALERYGMMNHQPAVDEPANDFEKVVNEHAALQAMLEEVKSLLKPAEAAERRLRDGIADSLRAFYGVDLKEGVNNYELSNGRFVKFTHKVDRKIESSMVVAAREAYEAAPDKPAGVAFDDLLRVKYELTATPFKKLASGSAASTAVSRMLVTKFAAPSVKVD